MAVIDCGSLATAAKRVGRSESALSLQMSRLEGIVGTPLFDRDGRGLKINQTGSNLLAHSRVILSNIDVARAQLGPSATLPARIGIVQDFVDSVLRPTVEDLQVEDSKASFEIVIGSTAELLQALGEDRIDTALCAGDLLGAEPIAAFQMEWFGREHLLDKDVVPLLSITPPCPFLTAAQQALDAVDRLAYRNDYTKPRWLACCSSGGSRYRLPNGGGDWTAFVERRAVAALARDSLLGC